VCVRIAIIKEGIAMAAGLKIVSFNMRMNNPGDGINAFPNRKGRIKEFIDGCDADVIGFQEILPEMRAFLVEAFPDYYMVGVGRGRNYDDESALIAFRKDRMELISCDTVMLSTTPRVFGSRYDGSDQSHCPREYVKVFLKHKSIDEPFYVYNVHTDHLGVMAREFASLQMLQDMNSHSYKVFFTGDFNAHPDEKSIRMIVENSTRPLVDAVGGAITFHNFGKITEGDSKIDYIFADKDTPVVESGVVKDEGVDGVYISDHYPIWAIFEV
jgi:endonuclease/exonuclease/phosphatase family metal-dependent hydrolase